MSGKVADWPNFYALFKDDEDKATDKIAAEAVAYITIFEDQILEQAQQKINSRTSHKNISSVLLTRLQSDLRGYLDQTIAAINKFELFQLKLQLFNTQLGLGNSELRKLTKNSDQVQQMKSILN